jgi:hypothetical protein
MAPLVSKSTRKKKSLLLYQSTCTTKKRQLLWQCQLWKHQEEILIGPINIYEVPSLETE